MLIQKSYYGIRSQSLAEKLVITDYKVIQESQLGGPTYEIRLKKRVEIGVKHQTNK